ncbi:MAG: YIP1 family protein [Limimaricola soesokkakensis]|uniref:YIP1 family protein n=1 Tax=Limimaricola soesokkakensis TaxID=1343159 RepID=UPI0040599E77
MWGYLTDLLRLSLRAPAEAAARLLRGFPGSTATWQALVLVTCVSVVVTALIQGAMPVMPMDAEGAFGLSPFGYAGLLGASLVLLAGGVTATGRLLGGVGNFGPALALVVWLEVLAMALRLVQGVLILVLPPLAGLVGLAGLVWLFWCLARFVQVLHGFQSVGRATVALFLAFIAIGTALALLLALTGLTAQGGLTNV